MYHAAFVLPAVFACYKTDGNLKKLKKDNAYLHRLIDANIEGYRAIRNAGHEILPDADRNLRVQHGQGKEALYFRWTCLCAGEISGAGLCPERPVHPHGGSADRKPALGHLTQFKNSPTAQQKRTSIQKNRCPF